MLRFSLVLALLLLSSLAVSAQDTGPATSRGIAVVHGWPDRSAEADTSWWSEVCVLPFLEGLALTYALDIEPEGPRWTYQLSWEPSPDGGVYRGQRVSARRLPRKLRLDLVELVAVVTVDGDSVGRVYLEAYDLDLKASSERITWEATPDWADLVEGLDAAEAEQVAREGFTLRHLQIRRIGFKHGRYESRPVTVYDAPWYRPPLSGDIWVTVRSGGQRVGSQRDGPPRRDTVTRNEDPSDRIRDRARDEERTREAGREDARGVTSSTDTPRERARPSSRGRSSNDRSSNDRDDEDKEDKTLLPTALVGAAAVGAVAVAGGTFGYLGHLGKAPFGLVSGYVAPQGGVLVNVAVNWDLLNQSDTRPEHLVGRLIGFGDLGIGGFQPSVGVGFVATQFDNRTNMDLSFSLGAVVNVQGALFVLGYDVAQQSLDLGLALNFRTLPR
ncbi:MAG: hypothetical protein AAGI71_09385 [Bacteroidota bacterium]